MKLLKVNRPIMRIYKRTARTDRWAIGYTTPAKNKQGFTVNYSLPSANSHIQDKLICKKGETYYTWHPKGQPWQYSREYPTLPPKPKSEWEEKFEEFQTKVSEIEFGSDDDNIDDEEKDTNKSNLISEIEEYRDQLQSRLDNMPQQLQESSVLNERIEELDNLIEQL